MIPHHDPGQLWAFASVQAGKSTLWAGTDALTLYVLIRIVHLAPDAAGAAFFTSSIFSALCDGALGVLLARSSRALRMLPVLVGFAIPICAISFMLLPVLTADMGFAGAAAVLMLTRGTYSLIDVSHNGLTGGLVERKGHLSLARVRAISTSSGALVIAMLSIPLFADADQGHRPVAAILGGAGLLAMALMAPLPLLLRNASRQSAITLSPVRVSPAILRFCLVAVVGLASVGAVAKALLHLEFAIANLMLWTLLIPTLARFGAVWLWTPVARRAGNERALAFALGVCGATSLLAPLLIAGGTIGTVVMMIVFGLGVGGVAMIWWAVLSERIKAAQPEPHAGREAGTYGLFTMAVKIGLGASGLLVGGWLSLEGRGTVAPAALAPLAIVAAIGCFAAAIGVMPGTARRMMRR